MPGDDGGTDSGLEKRERATRNKYGVGDGFRPLDMGLPWSRLDGSFCRRYEAAAVATRARFNRNPFAMLDPSGP